MNIDKISNNKVLIIAEAGVNHNGRLDVALQLCDAAKESGADVVKFQTWITEEIITHNVKQAEYQIANTGKTESQFDMLKRLELSFDDFATIKKHCDDIGIIFASTADDFISLDFLKTMGVPFFKVSSGDMCNVPYLRKVGYMGLPVILSTGMSSLADVELSVNSLREGGAEDITLLHCTTNYPCPYDEVNLNAMLTLKDAFKLPVGYSDHTIGCEIPVAAVALGATIIEKHFTLDRNMDGPDHLASMEPNDFKYMVEKIRHIENAMGNGIKKATKSESKISEVVTKRIVAKRDIACGELLDGDNITVKRSCDGELAREWDSIVGKCSKRSISFNEGIYI